MPSRHRFLEPIHNVKDGSLSSRPRPKPRRSGLHPWKNLERLAPLAVGGASRDRTDDLKLAKLALSQLSYGPGQPDPPLVRQRNPAPARNWWAWKELNFRPHAYQARALTN